MEYAKKIAALIAIAEAAIEADLRETAKKHRKVLLNHAYNRWKNERGIEHVERDSDEWEEMLAETKPEYREFERAKAFEKNSRARLKTAIRRYSNGADQ